MGTVRQVRQVRQAWPSASGTSPFSPCWHTGTCITAVAVEHCSLQAWFSHVLSCFVLQHDDTCRLQRTPEICRFRYTSASNWPNGIACMSASQHDA